MSLGIVEAFHATAQLSRSDVFDDQRLDPIDPTGTFKIAAPGWVGRNWQLGGTALIAINPGGGGDNYRVNPHDAELYALIRAFRDALPEQRSIALENLGEAWTAIQRMHNLWRVIDHVLDAAKSQPQSAAFLNVLPFRTRADKPARSVELRRAWEKGTAAQLEALAPRRIIALGCKAHDALLSVGADKLCEIILIKRMRGDSALSAHARATLEVIRQSRTVPM